jgi:hypothetical protein
MIVHGPGNRGSALFSFVRSLFSLLRAYPGCAGVTMSPLEVRESPALPLLMEVNPGSPGSERKGRDL